jgi:hypothetical protein
MKSETLRRMWALFAGALIFAVGSTARAADGGPADECQVDKDCPGDPGCGGPVCDWYVDPTHHKCVAAGGKKAGSDGWCNGANTDCKCASEGATCSGIACTFTVPKAGGAGGGSGTGGASGTGGSGTGGSGTGGTEAPAPASSDSGGGCTMASTRATGLGSAGLLVGLGAIAFGIRRRRHAA